jgi:hypothetical protein
MLSLSRPPKAEESPISGVSLELHRLNNGAIE